MESHFNNIHGAPSREVMVPGNLAFQESVSPYQHGPPRVYKSSPILNLMPPSLENPVDGFPKASEDQFPCKHGSCSISFKRAADLERHARAHQPGPKEYECPGPGCAQKGAKGFTRKDKLADHWKGKHLGALGEMGAWLM